MTENTEESPVVQEGIDIMASAVVAAGLWQSIPVLTVREELASVIEFLQHPLHHDQIGPDALDEWYLADAILARWPSLSAPEEDWEYGVFWLRRSKTEPWRRGMTLLDAHRWAENMVEDGYKPEEFEVRAQARGPWLPVPAPETGENPDA